jgi:hypothetical protein
MSVLTQTLKKRQQWHHLYDVRARQKKAHVNFDWIFYVAAGALVYTYRFEVIGYLVRVLEQL